MSIETNTQITTLDPLTFPLYGERLIEASAGTGKTYTIASLFIRLLLGHGTEKTSHQSPLTVDQILVVTFTEAATAELRTRIRDRIAQMRLVFVKGYSSDPYEEQLLEQTLDHKSAMKRLRFAELQMDEAAIYTIHGFCQRMLLQNAFESGSLFQQELLEDQTLFIEQGVNDFWRTHFYKLTKPLTKLIYSYWSEPLELKKALSSILSSQNMNFVPAITDFDFEAKYEVSIKRIDKLKGAWNDSIEDLLTIILDSDVSKRSYTKQNLPNWLDEITRWANTSSESLALAKNLIKFSKETLIEKTPKGVAPSHKIFDEIELILAEDLSLENTILIKAASWVFEHLQKNKKQQMLLGFDDLLTRLDFALQNSHEDKLALQIRDTYPIALIDEFQDTDPVQYSIFQTIYSNSSEGLDRSKGLFLIGDPKQAIYSFRGADIFTYMKARQNVSAHYNLDKNFRSSEQMIDGVNTFFNNVEAPFIYKEDIAFNKVSPSHMARKELCIEYDEQNPSFNAALQFIHPLKVGSSQEFKYNITKACVNEIKTILLLSQKNRAYLKSNDGKIEPIKANNIAILVRTGKEAKLIRDALLDENINSVYLSLKESVFKTPLAQDLSRILQACIAPDDERLLRSAIASKLFALSLTQTYEILSNTQVWEEKLQQFAYYKTLWLKAGILPMLYKLFNEQGVFTHLLMDEDGERKLTDLLHLCELLQKNSVEYDGPFALLRWYCEVIEDTNGDMTEQKQRLESERDLVQVSTLHKSKGLEYDIVFIPFAGIYQKVHDCIYHDPNKKNALFYDLEKDKDHFELAEKEQLAENLRLLYVGLTRSVYRSYLGIGSYKNGRVKNTPLVKTSLGYICLKGEKNIPASDSSVLNSYLDCMVKNSTNISVRDDIKDPQQRYVPLIDNEKLQKPSIFKTSIERNWWVTSYSSLSKFHTTPDLHPKALTVSNEITTVDPLTLDQNVKTPFNFPRGAKHGTFLHEIFEKIDFNTASIDTISDWLSSQLELNNYEEPELWTDVLSKWIDQILKQPLQLCSNDPINEPLFNLKMLKEKDKKVEMQFFIPMKEIQCFDLNRLIKKHDPLSRVAGDLQFSNVKGMLKGFIDLIFKRDGKYYILDYKSNHLGDSLEDYGQENLTQAIIEHRYDFQYQLYTLALHRLLQSRIPDYDYKSHMGGVYYTFLRGMQGDSNYGVFYNKPSFALIDGLDRLFKGEKLSKIEAEQALEIRC